MMSSSVQGACHGIEIGRWRGVAMYDRQLGAKSIQTDAVITFRRAKLRNILV
jgi:hypothetical protein